jgi:hypothetical protein
VSIRIGKGVAGFRLFAAMDAIMLAVRDNRSSMIACVHKKNKGRAIIRQVAAQTKSALSFDPWKKRRARVDEAGAGWYNCQIKLAIGKTTPSK